MAIDIFYLIGIFGLLILTYAILLNLKKSKSTGKYVYSMFVVGGLLLLIYSIYIKNTLFIILQVVFIIAAIYGLIKHIR